MASQRQRPGLPGTSKSKTPSPPRRATEENRSFQNAVISYCKKAVVILAVWAAGFYRFSPSWLLLALIVYVWKERQDAAKKQAIAIAQEIARNEKAAILARVEDLPSWVYFPDVERAEWVNKIVDQLWPYIGEYVRKLLKDTVEPKVKAGLPTSLDSFKFSKIDLGDIPPRIGGVKVYTSQVRRDEIYIDLELNYASDSNLAVQVKGMNFGVRDLTLRGTLRIIFRPLITKVPLIGGMSVFFLNNPELDFNLTNLANALDLPGLSDMLHSIIEEQIAEVMVLPNRIPIQIADNIDLRKLRYPLPQGVLQVHVVEARDLVHTDTKLFGKGKSDPYAIVTVGAQTFETNVINNCLAPVWNQVFEYVIDERQGQLLKVELKDKDTSSKDDPMGSTTMDISVICSKGSVEEWLPLEEVPKGIIHLRTTWLYLSSDPEEFTEMQQSAQDDSSLHSALLIVHLDSAIDLPRGQRGLQEPSPFALLTVGQVTQESSIRVATTEPSWDQTFRFFVANPNHQSLDVEIRDSKTKKDIGEMRVHLRKVMTAEDMILEQKFPLQTSESGSALFMTIFLRILTPHITPEWLESDVNSTTVSAESRSAVLHPTGAGATVTYQPGFPDPSTTASESHQEVTSSPSSQSQKAGVIQMPTTSSTAPDICAKDDSEVRQRKLPFPGSSSSPSEKDKAGEFGLGRLQLTLRYSAARQHLVVVLHKIVHLMPALGDSRGLADPYITMYLLPDRDSKTKRKTDVIKKDLNPVFDAKFDYAVSASDLRGRRLEMAVKNETGRFSSSQKLLGMVRVDLSSLDTSQAVTLWLDLAPPDTVKGSSWK